MPFAAVHGLLRSFVTLADVVRGRPARRRTPDRALLEGEILPAYAGRADVHRLLFVGCAAYTQHYARLFDHLEYWTLDAARRHRRWGGPRHIEDRLERLDRHVPGHYFDVIVCNGVLGWGLNRRPDVERAFDACFHALRAEGELLVGWNDVVPRNAVPPHTVRALRRYVPCVSPGVGGPVLRVAAAHRHVYAFYRKPGSSPAQADSVVGASGAGAQPDSGLQTPAAQSS